MIATEDIILLIRQAINECTTVDDSFSQEVDSALIDFVKLAAPLVALEAPVNFQQIETKTFQKSNPQYFFTRPDSLTGIRVPVPDNFCRFLSLRADQWPYAVSRIMPDNSPEFLNQYSSVHGIGAGPGAPMAFLSSELEGGTLKTFIIGHAVKGADNVQLAYVPQPVVSSAEITMDSRLQTPLVYYAASLYLQSIADVSGSKAALDTAQLYITQLSKSTIL